MTARRRIALIGAGSMGRNHARIIAESSAADLDVVVDPSDLGQAVAERSGARWVRDLDGLGAVDGAVIAAPTELHYALAAEVIHSGVPLLIEKPICPSLEQTVAILDATRQAGVPVMCGFLERYNPAFVVARTMVDEPRYVRAERHSPYAPRIRTGVAWDLLVHDVDLISQLMGSRTPDRIEGLVGHYHPDSASEAEDVVEAALGFEDGTIASASASRIGQHKVRKLTVQALDRLVEIDLLRREVTAFTRTTIEGDELGTGFRQSTVMEIPEVAGKEPLAAQFERFLALIDGSVDADAERESILPAHRIVEQVRTAA